MPERALADAEPAHRDGDAALEARRAGGAQAPRGDRQGARRGAGRQLRLADPLLRAAPVHDGQGPPHELRDGRRQPRPRRRPRRLRAGRAAAGGGQMRPAGGTPSGDHAAAAGTPAAPGPDPLAPDRRQPTTPYLDALVAYGFRGPTRFHVPGHKGGSGADPGLRWALGERALLLDVPQDTEGIDTGPEPTPYRQAEQLAAAAYGAAQSWFLTNGATQGNHALCLALAPPGTRVVLQRNVHASLIDGLVLSGGVPAFVAPETDDELGMAHGVTPQALRAVLERLDPADPVRAVFVVSPTYYGVTADVGGLAQVAHAAGAALVVDQAWGPHFGFHPGVPQSALALGADAVITSTHKIVGALTQAALLHVAAGGRVDPDVVARTVRLVRSTSPSSLLLASLDAARRQLAIHGQALLAGTLAGAAHARIAIDAVPGCAVVGERLVGRPGVHGWDPLRLVIDVRGTGCSGYEVAAALRAGSDIHVEL